MSIFCYSIPIESYDGNEVFFKQLYFEAESCPHKELFLFILNDKIKEEQKYYKDNPEYDLGYGSELEKVRDSLQYLDGFPWLNWGMINTNSFIDHPKLGRQPIFVTRIIPWEVK